MSVATSTGRSSMCCGPIGRMPRPPVHVPKEFPPDMDPSERARSHHSGAVAFSGRLSRSTPTIGKKPASDDLIPVVVARRAHALLAGADLHGPRDGEILTTST